jgi:hypothetical protein
VKYLFLLGCFAGAAADAPLVPSWPAVLLCISLFVTQVCDSKCSCKQAAEVDAWQITDVVLCPAVPQQYISHMAGPGSHVSTRQLLFIVYGMQVCYSANLNAYSVLPYCFMMSLYCCLQYGLSGIFEQPTLGQTLPGTDI